MYTSAGGVVDPLRGNLYASRSWFKISGDSRPLGGDSDMRLARFSICSFALTILMVALAAEAQPNAASLVGQWEGSYTPRTKSSGVRSRELGTTGRITKLPVLVTITAGADGKLAGTWTGTTQQGTQPLEIAVEGDVIRLTNPVTMSVWEGELSKDGAKLDGTWKGRTFGGDATAPLDLTRKAQ